MSAEHPPTATPAVLRRAERHLRAADSVMRGIIASTGRCRLDEHERRAPFHALVRAIISQQISIAAAQAIERKVARAFGGRFPSARRLAGASDEELRAAGLSSQKARYVRDLAERVASRRLRLRALARLPDEAVIEDLVQVKGIGLWTAQMFLIFRLGRLDVLPVEELGLLEGARLLYGLAERPDAEGLTRLADPWRPYRSVGCWYLWRGRRSESGDGRQ